MPDPQSPEAQAATIEAMANKALGQPNAPGPQAPQAPAPAATDQPKPTAMEQGTQQGAPKTEADKASMEPVKYRIKMGEEERELTEAQIAGTFDRYGKLNETVDYMRPVMNMAAQVLQQNPNMTPEGLVKSFVEMANQPMQHGGPDARPNEAQPAPAQSAEDISKKFEQWEKDNAASLPPGYADMMSTNSAMQNQMQQMMGMMQQVLGRTQGMVDASRTAAGDARNQTVNATKQKIANNLNAVQQKLGLPDEQGDAFMSFAAERGYTMEDFIDPVITLKVANDFKNNINAGEFGRLTDMAQRRQAFTGSVETQPGQGPTSEEGVDQNLQAMINKHLPA